MLNNQLKYHLIFLLVFLSQFVKGEADKFRVMWREDPATTMVIGWNQKSGSDPMLLIDAKDHGKNYLDYAYSLKPSYTNRAKGMHNHFVRLKNLRPNTKYYFLIKDSEGVSNRYSFSTAPDNAAERLSIIAGGDSRNNRAARRDANLMVSKLKPHCVMFGGDMTGGDNAEQWNLWFDDWQLTITNDGHITPIIVTRGNHEQDNQSIISLFDVKSTDVYYALNLGGDLLRVYTLNSMIPAGGNQKDWLERDLKAHTQTTWKMAQYHHTIRPHTYNKPEKNEQLINWATLFHKYQVNLVVESDAHVVKATWPIRPSNEAGSEEGFIRDDEEGTVYVGEGCWGAPLRSANDDKNWTRNSGSFNQFKWIFVDSERIEIRTVMTDNAAQVNSVSSKNIFKVPSNITLWKPSNGDVITILKDGYQPEPDFDHEESVVDIPNGPLEILDFQAVRSGDDVAIKWNTMNEPRGILYEVQRSTDSGANYVNIERLRGKSGATCSYQIFDIDFAKNNPGTFVSYRLKRIMPDGQSHIHEVGGKKKKPTQNYQRESVVDKPSPAVTPPVGNGLNWDLFPAIECQPGQAFINVKYNIERFTNVTILLLNKNMEALEHKRLTDQAPKDYQQKIDVSAIRPGQYLLVVKTNQRVLRRFRVYIPPA